MNITVAKFGGSSLKDNKSLFIAASAIKQLVKSGKNVVVVVSARGKTTDSLIKSAEEVCGSDNIPKKELDNLLATGEQMSAALFAMALNKISVKSVSLTGEKAGIITNSEHNNASICEIKTKRIEDLLLDGYTVVVAGFQGADLNGNITTLGRGGSDTTAAALSVALNAESCLIYTDLNGIYTADPRKIQSSKKYDSVSFHEMEEFSRLGAKVLSFGSAEIAAKNKVKMYVLSPSEQDNKTLLCEQTLPRYSDITGVTIKSTSDESIISAVCADSEKTPYYLNK